MLKLLEIRDRLILDLKNKIELTDRDINNIYKAFELLNAGDNYIYFGRLDRIKNMIINGKTDLLFYRLRRLKGYNTPAVTKYKLCLLYGKEAAIIRWNQYRDKQAYSNSFEYKKIKNGMNIDEFNAFNKSRAITLENMIGKYGEIIGTEKFNSYRLKQVSNGNSLEYFVKKYGEIDGFIKHKKVCFLKGHSVDSYIERHGDVDRAMSLYSSFLLKVSCNTSSTSKVATEMFNDIFSKMPANLHSKTYFNSPFNNKKEFVIADTINKKCYLYDFVISSLKLCIEFNGNYWHANPRYYSSGDIIRNKTVDSIWSYDKNKIEAIENRGFQVIIVWEDEYINNKLDIINFILNTIKRLGDDTNIR